MMYPKDVDSNENLVLFIKQLANESSKSNCDWENDSLPRFLEAMAAWTNAGVEDWYKVNEIDISEVNKWRMFADILMAATMYE